MYILFIDDSIERHALVDQILGKHHSVIHAYNYDDVVNYFPLCSDRIGLAMFDHDLQDIRQENNQSVEYDGSKIASYMLNNLPIEKLPLSIVVHSFNYSGAANIASKFKSANIPVLATEQFSEQLLNRILTIIQPN